MKNNNQIHIGILTKDAGNLIVLNEKGEGARINIPLDQRLSPYIGKFVRTEQRHNQVGVFEDNNILYAQYTTGLLKIIDF